MTTLRRPPVRRIGQVIQNARLFNLKQWRDAMITIDSLPQNIAQLFRLLTERHIDYVLVGGVALLSYIEGRNTEDIDLIIASPALDRLPEVRVLSQDNDFVRGQFEQLQLDLLLTRNPLFEQVRRQHTTRQPFAEQTIPTATVEGLLLLKFYALPSLYRQGSFARVSLYENDIAMLVQAYRPDLEPLFQELTPYLEAGDLTAVREIAAEIQQRIDRFGKGLSRS